MSQMQESDPGFQTVHNRKPRKSSGDQASLLNEPFIIPFLCRLIVRIFQENETMTRIMNYRLRVILPILALFILENSSSVEHLQNSGAFIFLMKKVVRDSSYWRCDWCSHFYPKIVQDNSEIHMYAVLYSIFMLYSARLILYDDPKMNKSMETKIRIEQAFWRSAGGAYKNIGNVDTTQMKCFMMTTLKTMWRGIPSHIEGSSLIFPSCEDAAQFSYYLSLIVKPEAVERQIYRKVQHLFLGPLLGIKSFMHIESGEPSPIFNPITLVVEDTPDKLSLYTWVQWTMITAQMDEKIKSELLPQPTVKKPLACISSHSSASSSSSDISKSVDNTCTSAIKTSSTESLKFKSTAENEVSVRLDEYVHEFQQILSAPKISFRKAEMMCSAVKETFKAIQPTIESFRKVAKLLYFLVEKEDSPYAALPFFLPGESHVQNTTMTAMFSEMKTELETFVEGVEADRCNILRASKDDIAAWCFATANTLSVIVKETVTICQKFLGQCETLEAKSREKKVLEEQEKEKERKREEQSSKMREEARKNREELESTEEVCYLQLFGKFSSTCHSKDEGLVRESVSSRSEQAALQVSDTDTGNKSELSKLLPCSSTTNVAHQSDTQCKTTVPNAEKAGLEKEQEKHDDTMQVHPKNLKQEERQKQQAKNAKRNARKKEQRQQSSQKVTDDNEFDKKPLEYVSEFNEESSSKVCDEVVQQHQSSIRDPHDESQQVMKQEHDESSVQKCHESHQEMSPTPDTPLVQGNHHEELQPVVNPTPDEPLVQGNHHEELQPGVNPTPDEPLVHGNHHEELHLDESSKKEEYEAQKCSHDPINGSHEFHQELSLKRAESLKEVNSDQDESSVHESSHEESPQEVSSYKKTPSQSSSRVSNWADASSEEELDASDV